MTEPATRASPASPATDARPASPATSVVVPVSPAVLPRIFDDDGAPAREVCHRCGYPMIGLPRDNACPECGQPAVAGLVVAYFGDPPTDVRRWLGRNGRMFWLAAATAALAALAVWWHPMFWGIAGLVVLVSVWDASTIYRGDHPRSQQLRINDAGLLITPSREEPIWSEFIGMASFGVVIVWLSVIERSPPMGFLGALCAMLAFRVMPMLYQRYWPVPAKLRSLQDPQHRSVRPIAWSPEHIENAKRTEGGMVLMLRTGMPLLRRFAWHDRIIEIPCSDRDADFLVKLIEHHVKQHARPSASSAAPAK